MHYCNAIKCNRSVKPKYLFCTDHWRKLPTPLKAEVNRNYRSGQENTKKVTEAYIRASFEAINYVAITEGNKPFDIEKRVKRLKNI